MYLEDDIKNLLLKNEIKIKNHQTTGQKNDLLEIFYSLTPERVLQYELDCIDDIEYYINLLKMYGDITLEEFKPTEIKVSGTIEKTIYLSFNFLEKKRQLKIKQDELTGSAENFNKKLCNHCKKLLHGMFLELQTKNQTYAVVYLPKKVISTIQRQYLIMKDADSIVEFIANGGCPTKINWEYTNSCAYNGFTKNGETVVTYIIKTELKEYGIYHGMTYKEGLMEIIYDSTPINPYIQNKSGETPLSLIKKYNMQSMLLELTVFLNKVETSNYSEILSRQTRKVSIVENDDGLSAVFKSLIETHRYTDEMKDIFEKAKPYIQEMFFEKINPFIIEFSFSENFYPGENSLKISSNYFNKKFKNFTLFVQKRGNPSHTINIDYELTEMDTIIETIKLYCTNELWS